MNQFNAHKLTQFFLPLVLVGLVFSCIDGELFAPDADAPTISNFSPENGLPGTRVIINGENFDGSPGMDSVYFNGYGAEVLTSSPTQIEALVPTAATTGPIVVRELSLNKRGISSTDFEVLTIGPPRVEIYTLRPSSGIVGSLFQILGINFGLDVNQVTVRLGLDTAQVRSISDTLIIAEVPENAITSPVNVIKSGQATTGPEYAVIDANPEIDTLKPVHGPVGTTVWIIGKYFSSVPDDNIISFNGVSANVLEAHNDSLKTEVPASATTGKVTVLINGNTGEWPLFTVDPFAPVITSLDPESGKAGISVTINGNHFSGVPAENIVTFNGEEATVTSASKTELKVIVPSAATTGPVAVTVNGLTVTGPLFAVVSSDVVVTSIEPTTGKVGIPVTIKGENFGNTPSENKVTFNGVETSITSATITEIVAVVPQGATTGPVIVTVGGLSGVGPDFTVEPSPPTITSLNPTSGQVGSSVKIVGTNFNTTPATNTVTFNGTNASVTSASTTELTVNVPVGASTGQIIVTVGGLTSNGVNFTVLPTPPQITSINPTSGQAGSSVKIVGTNFSTTPAKNTVTFNGTNASVTSASATELTANVPMDASTGQIIVTVGGLTSNGVNFTVLPTPPQITSIDPNTGPYDTQVKISGTDFSSVINENQVKFNRLDATILSASTTDILAVVPLGAGSGLVEITTNGLTSNGVNFSYVKTPFVSTQAGNGTAGFVDGSALNAQFNQPTRIAIDSKGQLVVVDLNNHSIRLISTDGIVTTIAGDGVAGYTEGNGASARFNSPAGVAIDNSGNIYIADNQNHVIRKISPSYDVSTFAGSGQPSFIDDANDKAGFNSPYDVAFDSNGDLFVVDAGNHSIRKISPTGDVTTVAGNGTPGATDGKGTEVRFFSPLGIGINRNDVKYIADGGNHAIRQLINGNVTTLTNSDGTPGSTDGPISSARFNFPSDIDVDATGNLYIADYANHKIRKLRTDDIVETLAGTGVDGFQDGRADVAQFNFPIGVTVLSNEIIYVGDVSNNRIRIITYE